MAKTNEVKLTKRADSGIYQATVDGKRISLGTRNREEAISTAREAKLPQVAALSKANALTKFAFEALTNDTTPNAAVALAMWQELRVANGKSANTIARDVSVVQQFLRDTGTSNLPLSRIEERHVGSFINADGANSASTRHRSLACLRGFFEFALYRGYCKGNVAANVDVNYAKLDHEQKEPGKHEAFTEAQYQKLLHSEHLEGWWTDAVPIAYAAGLRMGDVSCLERASVTKDGLIVHTEKTSSRVLLPFDDTITPGLRETLDRIPVTDDRYFFPDEAAIHLDVNRRSRHSVYFQRILVRIGIEGRNFHGLRATCARRWRSLGFTLDSCRLMLGHGSEAITAGYTGEKIRRRK
jgi:integrase